MHNSIYQNVMKLFKCKHITRVLNNVLNNTGHKYTVFSFWLPHCNTLTNHTLVCLNIPENEINDNMSIYSLCIIKSKRFTAYFSISTIIIPIIFFLRFHFPLSLSNIIFINMMIYRIRWVVGDRSSMTLFSYLFIIILTINYIFNDHQMRF